MGFKRKLRQLFGLSPKKKVPPKQEGSDANSYRSVDRELEEEFASLSNKSGTPGAVKYGFGVIDDTCLEGSEERATFAVDVFHDAENCAVRQVGAVLPPSLALNNALYFSLSLTPAPHSSLDRH